MQSQVIIWLAALPLVLAMFRAITIGDRLYAPVQTGLSGGHHKQLVNLALAGLTMVGLLLMFIVGSGAPGAEDPLALTLLAFGAFVFSGYMAAGFRRTTWQKFVGHAFHEAGLYWLVLGLCRLMLLITDRATPAGGDAAAAPKLVFLEAVIWAVISLVSLTLIVGTASRMMRR